MLPILHVETAHSHYIIDQNNGTFQRLRVHQDANDLSKFFPEGEPIKYGEIYGPNIGESMFIETPDGSWLRSTPVVSVGEVSADAQS